MPVGKPCSGPSCSPLRAADSALIASFRACAKSVAAIDCRIERLDPSDRCFHELDRRDFLGSRYDPLQLDRLLAGQKNWLLSEFIEMSPSQFIDEIASEITGYQFLVPNVRAAV